MDILDDDLLEQELGGVGTIEDWDAGLKNYPHWQLSSRDFELLNCALFRKSAPPEAALGLSWDRASLAKGGPDKGRDVVLLSEGAIVGVVQCKGGHQQVSLPEVMRELAKVILLLDQDDSTVCDTSKLAYFLALAKEPSGTVISFFSNPAQVLGLQPDYLRDAVRAVAGKYRSLGTANSSEAQETVFKVVETMSFWLLRPPDLNVWLAVEESVAVAFFRHSAVAMPESEVRAFDERLDTILHRVEGIPAITDADLGIVKRAIEDVPESHRLSLGFVSLFGFPRQMFAGRAGVFRKRIKPVADLMNELYLEYMNWMFDRANMEALWIASRFSVRDRIHPFATEIPRAFLGTVAHSVTSLAVHGELFAEIIQKAAGGVSLKDYESRMAHVQETLLEAGRRYLVEDYSEVKGEGDFLAAKLALIQFMMVGIRSEADLERILDEAEVVLRPYLKESSEELERLGSQRLSIFLMGTSGMDDREQVLRTGQTARALDNLTG